MIQNIKWISGPAQNPSTSKKSKSKSKSIIPGTLSREELDAETRTSQLFGGGPVGGSDSWIPESNVRSEVRVSHSGVISNVGMGSWMKAKPRRRREKVDVDVEVKERSVEALAEAAATLLPALETGSSSKGKERGSDGGSGDVVERVTERMIENVNAGDSGAV